MALIIKRSVIFVEIGMVVEEIVLSVEYIVTNVVNLKICKIIPVLFLSNIFLSKL